MLPLSHIKLGLMKNFVEAIEETQAAFKDLSGKFPRLSEAKIEEVVFVSPQICGLLRDYAFDYEMTAWKAFQ